MTEYRLELPYSVPPLSLNQSMHHMKLAGWKKQIESDTRWLARAARLPKNLDRVHIELHWQPGTTRRRDTDNPTPTLKKVIDALVKERLVTDDDSMHVSSECIIEPTVQKQGKVWVVIKIVEPQVITSTSR